MNQQLGSGEGAGGIIAAEGGQFMFGGEAEMRKPILNRKFAGLAVAACLIAGGSAASASPLYDQAVLDLDAIGYWKLDGNADDSSGNGHHGVATDITWLSDGPADDAPGAARGNGSTGVIHVSNDTALMPTGSMSVVAWVHKESSPVNWAQIASVNDRGWNLRFNGHAGQSDYPAWYGRNDAGDDQWVGDQRSELDTLPHNEWAMLVGVYDLDDDRARLYVNGELAFDISAIGDPLASNQTVDMTIFAQYDGIDANTAELRRFFEGDISRLSLHGTALSDTDVANLYAAIPEPGTLSLLGIGGLLLLKRRRA